MTLSRFFLSPFLLFFGLTITTTAYTAGPTIPTRVAGFALGSNVKSYPDAIQSNFLKEVVVTDYHGFRKGVISYGGCLYLDNILKIDMKYEDRSKRFYKQLLKRFKKKFGEPDIWLGDSFGQKYIWKWQFTDDENNKITLKLQHNTKDSNETIGNMVKLSYPQKIAEERSCFMDKCDEQNEKKGMKKQEKSNSKDWENLIPR